MLTPDIQVVKGTQKEQNYYTAWPARGALHRQPKAHRDIDDFGSAAADGV
jgi:hypothetical protein